MTTTPPPDPASREPHRTIPVKVWADIDVGMAGLVEKLNTIPGVRTHASCQGSMGEGGAMPYPAYVMVSWSTPEAEDALDQLGLIAEGEGTGRLYPSAEILDATIAQPKAEASDLKRAYEVLRDGHRRHLVEPMGGDNLTLCEVAAIRDAFAAARTEGYTAGYDAAIKALRDLAAVSPKFLAASYKGCADYLSTLPVPPTKD